jgi:hypothetical protein
MVDGKVSQLKRHKKNTLLVLELEEMISSTHHVTVANIQTYSIKNSFFCGQICCSMWIIAPAPQVPNW